MQNRPPKDLYYDHESEDKDMKTEEDAAKKQKKQGNYFLINKFMVICYFGKGKKMYHL